MQCQCDISLRVRFFSLVNGCCIHGRQQVFSQVTQTTNLRLLITYSLFKSMVVRQEIDRIRIAKTMPFLFPALLFPVFFLDLPNILHVWYSLYHNHCWFAVSEQIIATSQSPHNHLTVHYMTSSIGEYCSLCICLTKCKSLTFESRCPWWTGARR